ncbi:hypothetical protein [Actinomadura madurae]|uniref:Transcriptional regulator, AbiEi antitoxin, Type IV TA system n=1 Tax=Actinomadura madurae TaxID=1993 RepID=A0A1I4XVJ9_9ACTN|nr:hypothetical protein [Actinomadura madurae]SFN29865.1 hypothetical protein SAMN04489713_1011049 [Actinomadura madurae]SPT63666.1 Uncharacterised protein [Actinomadura madurae]
MNGFSLTWKRTAAGIVPVGPGAYFVPVKGASLTARAAALSGLLPDDVVIARRTAAWIWGLDVLPPGVNEADWDVELITPRSPGTDSGVPAFTAENAALPADHVVERSDVRVTCLARTALDCARWLPRYEAVAALDQFLRRGVDPGELTAMARTLPGYRGNKRLRQIVRLGDRGAASPGESWTRVAVVEAGFPPPKTQVQVMGPRGHWWYIDLGYPEYRVGLEYDGERHHTGREARAHDTERRRWLAKEAGWDVIPVSKNFLTRPAPYLEALLTALLQRGWKADDATMDHVAARLAFLRRQRGEGNGARRRASHGRGG